MANLDPLKKANELLKALVKEKEKENSNDNEAVVMAAQIQATADIVEAIEKNSLKKEEVSLALSELKLPIPQVTVNVPEVKVPTINVPEIKLPDIQIPEIKLPTINVPEIKIPEIKLPTINVPEPKVTVNVPDIKMPDQMDIKGWVQLQGVNLENPLPVQLRDKDGKPVSFDSGGNILSGGGGARVVSSKLMDGAGNRITSTDGALNVSVSGVNVTVNASDIQIGAVELKDGGSDNRAAISATGVLSVDGSSVTQPISSANTLDVRQVSGANWSVSSIPLGNSWLSITGAATSTVVKVGAGVLHTATINKRGTGSTLTLYGDLVGEGSLIATIDTTLSTTAFLYDIAFTSGLTAVTVGASAADLTISYY